MRKILLDGDVMAYRAACSNVEVFRGDPEWELIEPNRDGTRKRPPTKEEALSKLDTLLQEALEGASGSDFTADVPFEVFITGKGNFRNDFAVTAPYKGNRKDIEKPAQLEACRQHLEDKYGATKSEGEEADDLLAMRATELGPDGACIASTDKDMLQVNCWHYNLTKQELTFVEEFEGLRWFYGQIIEGDRADNIIGVKGIGPKKREKILAECLDEGELYAQCEVTFRESGLGLEEATNRIIENGRLAWLRRFEGQIWEPFWDIEDAWKW